MRRAGACLPLYANVVGRPLILISTLQGLDALARALTGVTAIGVDVEGDSFFSYREKTCLVQISTEDQDYIVDPLALPDLSPLNAALADPGVLKVFHAADNDVAALRRDFGIETRHLFDTMLAARILGLPRFGLADFLREYFGTETNKRLQRYAWGARPLNQPALEYAAMDSHYLIPLSERLRAQLDEEGRLEEAEDEFRRLEGATAVKRPFNPESFWRIKGSYGLEGTNRAVLRELYIWRDRQAAAADRPPFRIAPDSALLAVAMTLPRELRSLHDVSGLPSGIAQRHSTELLAAVRRGIASPVPQPPRAARPDEAVQARYEALRHWRKQVAGERGVAPDVIVSNAALQMLAARAPASMREIEALGVLGPWKSRTYGPALLIVLAAKQG